jgi:hypothetical protein
MSTYHAFFADWELTLITIKYQLMSKTQLHNLNLLITYQLIFGFL